MQEAKTKGKNNSSKKRSSKNTELNAESGRLTVG